MSEPSFKPHSIKQQEAIFSDKKFTLLASGIQFGKSLAGAVWLKRLVHKHTDPSDNFIILAPTYKILQQSTLPAFFSIMEGIGLYKKVDAVFDIFSGGKIYVRSATDPDSIVGITNVRALWIDECGLLRLYAFENAIARCAFKNAPMMLTTSPYSLNWVYKDIIKPYKKGERHDEICLIQARSDENPLFPKSEYETRKKTMDPRRFNMVYGGAFDKAEGLVYDCLDEDYNFVDPFELPLGTRYFGGVDWGYNDPFVIIIRAVTPSGDQYEVSEFYKTRMTVSEIMDVIRKKNEIFHVERFYCDPSLPAYISELQQMKIPAYPADNSIRIGIDRHYELIKSRKLKFFRGHLKFTLDEYETYHYPDQRDLKPDQSQNENMFLPVDADNHCLDASRYLTISLHHSTQIFTPSVPQEFKKQVSQAQRIERLKKRPQYLD